MKDTHKLPEVASDAKQHELAQDCWCKPMVVEVWEGTQYHERILTHNQESRKKKAPRRR